MKNKRYVMALTAVAVLGVTAGCGGATGTATAAASGATITVMPDMPTMSTASPPELASPGPSGRQRGSATSVGIVDFAFAPAILKISVGTTVTWTNHDQDAHDVTERTGAFRSPTLNTGDSFTFTFTKPGQYQYLCTIHPFMTATVVVTP